MKGTCVCVCVCLLGHNETLKVVILDRAAVVKLNKFPHANTYMYNCRRHAQNPVILSAAIRSQMFTVVQRL